LKTGKIEEDVATKSHFKPTIEPLQKIVDNSSTRAIKDVPRDDDDVKTLSVQKREEDAKSNKRKRSNTSLNRKSKRLDALGLEASPITFTPSATTVEPTMPELLANEDVFETTDDSLAESVQNQVANAGRSKNIERNVARTLRSAESKIRRSYFDR